MNRTNNYKLCQWEADDKIQRVDFNGDNAKIDGALADHEGRVAALEEAAPFHGNCQVYTTTYTGTGEFGESHPNQLTFPRRPALVIIVSEENGRPLIMAYGCKKAFLDTNGTASHNNTVTWNDRAVSWYGPHEMTQMNMPRASYYVTAFFLMN